MSKLRVHFDNVNFEFLNGFRGLCALWVVISHSIWNQNINGSDFLFFFYTKSQAFAVNGFFILSSFLLTYRLIIDLNNKNYALTLVKYVIRRLFRIYFVYAFACTLIIFGPTFMGGYFNYQPGNYYSSWFELITLRNAGKNHLWTITPEIKFYFILPILPILRVILTEQLRLVLLVALIVLTHVSLFFNLYNLPDDAYDFLKNSHYALMLALPIFIQGSTLALLFRFLEENFLKKFENFLDSSKLLKSTYKILLNISTLYLICLAFDSSTYNQINQAKKHTNGNYLLIPGYLWSIVLLIMLISGENENVFKDFLEKNIVLKEFGKYSFGAYIWHPMCILLEYNHKNIILITNYVNRYLFIVCMSFFVGWIFFHTIENNSIRIANYLCKILEIKFSNNEDDKNTENYYFRNLSRLVTCIKDYFKIFYLKLTQNKKTIIEDKIIA